MTTTEHYEVFAAECAALAAAIIDDIQAVAA